MFSTPVECTSSYLIGNNGVMVGLQNVSQMELTLTDMKEGWVFIDAPLCFFLLLYISKRIISYCSKIIPQISQFTFYFLVFFRVIETNS